MNVSAFFPAHNEEGNIAELTKKTLYVLNEICDEYEVIIVNDGSKDRTLEVAKELAEIDGHVKVVNHEVNRGYGAAVKSGFVSAKYEWVFFTDGDGQFDVNEIKKLTGLTGDYDVIAGYRINRQDPFHRKLNAKMWSTLVNILFRLGIRDVDCAFKLLKKEILDKNTLEADGAMISTELLAKAKKRGYRIGEVGVRHYPRKAGEQSGAKLKVIIKAFIELFRLYKKLR